MSESFETRVGEFGRTIPGFNESGTQKVLTKATENDSLGNLVTDENELEDHDFLLGVHDSLERYDDVEMVLNHLGSLGYYLGREMNNEASARDLESNSNKISSSLYIIGSENPLEAYNELISSFSEYGSTDSEMYGLPYQEVREHLEDSMWIGFMERNIE